MPVPLAGCRMPYAGCWPVPDAGGRMPVPDAGGRMPDAGCRMPAACMCQRPDANGRLPDAGCRVPVRVGDWCRLAGAG